MNKKRLVGGVLLTILLFIFLTPIFWMIIQSFKESAVASSVPPKLIPWVDFKPTMGNYISVLSAPVFINSFINSVIISLSSVGISLAMGIPAAYALARLNISHADDIRFMILTTWMMPAIILAVPFIIWFRYIGLLGSLLGEIIACVPLSFAIVVWVMESFFRKIPTSLEEAAQLEGCSRFKIFRKISLPLARSGVIAVATLGFLFSWMETLFPLIIGSSRTFPLSVTVPSEYSPVTSVLWGEINAAGILTIIPVIIVIIIARKYIATGLSFGVTK